MTINSLQQHRAITTTNFTLLARLSPKGSYAYFTNFLIVGLYGLIIWLFITEIDNEDIQLAPSFVMFRMSMLYIIIAISSLMFRYTDNTRCVHPRSISIFPFTDKNIYFFIVWDLLFNLNSAGFFLLSLCIALKLSPYPASISLLLSTATSLAFMIFCIVWITNIYILAAKLFQKFGNILSIVSILLLGPFNYILSKLIQGKSNLEFDNIPIIGWPGFGVLGMQNGSLKELVMVTFVLLLSTSVGVAVGLISMRKLKYSFYSWTAAVNHDDWNIVGGD